ncbi:ketoacyl-ACP synthase III [Maribellus mangrovi]|uniref:ketoacyl-ACP synthase III n=1 Tax=Maribellus mangrovi TaxID=3133146 RepID=UPI0030EC74CC
MVGIKSIAYYIPERKRSNYNLKEKFQIDDSFIESRIGIKEVALKEENEEASDLCVKAYEELTGNTGINIDNIDCIVVVTQNPDYNIPHTSAIVHGKLGAKETCACFDVSLGCSGYVYGLSVIKSFMEGNGFSNGLLFTGDPYSKNINPEDKNTYLLFGDAASVTWMAEDFTYEIAKTDFGTMGKDHAELICDGKISMNGRAIFNFAARKVPGSVKKALKINDTEITNIDFVIFHQGSKYIVDTLSGFLKLNEDKAPFDIADYGNTVSSSIPIILAKNFENNKKNILITGFGVGLSWATTILKHKN